MRKTEDFIESEQCEYKGSVCRKCDICQCDGSCESNKKRRAIFIAIFVILILSAIICVI